MGWGAPRSIDPRTCRLEFCGIRRRACRARSPRTRATIHKLLFFGRKTCQQPTTLPTRLRLAHSPLAAAVVVVIATIVIVIVVVLRDALEQPQPAVRLDQACRVRPRVYGIPVLWCRRHSGVAGARARDATSRVVRMYLGKGLRVDGRSDIEACCVVAQFSLLTKRDEIN